MLISTSACAMRTRSYDKVVDNCRRIAQLHQFRQEPFLLILGALGGGGIKASNAWQSLQLQKFLHRDLRIHDDVVRGRKVTFSAPTGRWSTVIKIGLSRRLGDEIEENGTEREATNNDEDDEADGDEEDEGRDILAEADIVRPTVFSPKLNVLYGQIMLSTKAYQSALCESPSNNPAHDPSLNLEQSICSEPTRSFKMIHSLTS